MRKIFLFTVLVAGALACSSVKAQQSTNRLSIGTGGTSGVFYPIGGGIANLISKSIPGVQATAEVTGGSVDNLKLIGAGQSEMAIVAVDAALEAFRGEDKFKGNPVPALTLMVMYPNRMHVVTVEGNNIEKFSDLKGKRISTGAPGSATELMTLRTLEAYGIDKDKDVKRERLSVAESVNAVKDRKLDAFFFVAGLPTAGITDLAATPGVKMKLIDHIDVVAKINAKHGQLYAADKIPAGTYPNQTKDNQVMASWNLLVAHKNMTEKLAYDILKIIFDNKDYLVSVHKESMNFDIKNQSGRSSIPWHPAAIKFFGEKGIKLN